MKVKELIAALSEMNPNADVIMQKDAEGNGYSPLRGVDPDAIYVPDSTWSGEVYDSKWTADEAGQDEKAWTKLKKRPRCVVLFPVN